MIVFPGELRMYHQRHVTSRKTLREVNEPDLNNNNDNKRVPDHSGCKSKKMNLRTKKYMTGTCLTASVTLLIGLALARPAIAEPTLASNTKAADAQPQGTPATDTLAPGTQAVDPQALANLRRGYDTIMATFDFLLARQGDTSGQDRVAAAREAMKALTDEDLARAFSRTSVPDLSRAVAASERLMARQSHRLEKAIPAIAPLPSGCNGVDSSEDTLYIELVAKETADSLQNASEWGALETILGENGALAVIPLAIAADIANGLYDVASFCAASFTANETDAIYAGLSDIESTDAANTTTIMNNDNANATMIINTDNLNTATILNADNANTTTIVNNDNANTTAIINNANANTTAIINNANANTTTLVNLMLRTQIEQSLTVTDNGAEVALFELPTAHGGYLDLVQTIVTQTLANIQAAGGSIGPAQPFLTAANTAKAAGNFKLAYFNYKQAYQAAGH